MNQKIFYSLSGVLLGLVIVSVFLADPEPDRHERTAAADASQIFISVAQKTRPSVVQVKSLTKMQEDNPFDDAHASFLEKLKRSILSLYWDTYNVKSLGSGIVINKRGYIVTNNHVIDGADRILVKAYGASADMEASIVGTDPMTDLALIKVSNGHDLIPVKLGSSADLQPGQWVAAIGAPFNLEGSFTVGVISALQRTGIGLIDLEDFIQTDAQIYPGNSGGPLCDIYGRVIGVNTAVFGLGYGIGFAIPSDTVKRVSSELIRKGRVERGAIGLRVSGLTGDDAGIIKISPGQRGVFVVEAIEGSPSEKAGFKGGDIIVTYNSQSVDSPGELQKLVFGSRVGSIAEIGILRGGKPSTIRVTIGAYRSS